MKRICLPLLLLLSASMFAGTKKMTVEDSLAIHRVAAPKFSPDGNALLYTETEWDRKNDRQVSHIYVSRAVGRSAREIDERREGRDIAAMVARRICGSRFSPTEPPASPRQERADPAIRSG